MAIPNRPTITVGDIGLTTVDLFGNVYSEVAGGPRVSDTFERPDSTTSLGTAPTGQVWRADIGTWGIQAGQAYAVSGATGDIATVDAGVADTTVSSTLTNTSNSGVVFRFVSTNTYLMARWNGSQVQLWRYNNGFNQLGSSNFTGSGFHKLAIEGNLGSIRVLLNDVERLAVTLSAADQTTYGAATRHGLRSVEGTVRFDSFSVL